MSDDEGRKSRFRNIYIRVFVLWDLFPRVILVAYGVNASTMFTFSVGTYLYHSLSLIVDHPPRNYLQHDICIPFLSCRNNPFFFSSQA